MSISPEARKEKEEHPWLSNADAERVVTDHKLKALEAKASGIQRRDLVYPILAYKGTKLPKILPDKRTTIIGLSDKTAKLSLTGKTYPPHKIVQYPCAFGKCKEGHEFTSSSTVFTGLVPSSYVCPTCGQLIQEVRRW